MQWCDVLSGAALDCIWNRIGPSNSAVSYEFDGISWTAAGNPLLTVSERLLDQQVLRTAGSAAWCGTTGGSGSQSK